MPRVLLATAEPAYPVRVGGIQASAHDLLLGLGRRPGYSVQLLSAAPRMYLDRHAVALAEAALPVRRQSGRIGYRTDHYTAQLVDVDDFEAALHALLAQEVFDVVVAQAAGWRTVVRLARAAGRPVVHWLHGWLGLLGDPDWPRADLLLANSRFTARHVADHHRLHAQVFQPPVEPTRVRAAPGVAVREAITLINPHPDKGVTLFLELARLLPHRRFVAVDCWGTPPFVERALRSEPNITYLPVQRRLDSVYGETALLLVPSLVDETFGRVVVEAGFNGIPVLASDRGALPDVVGCGGMLASLAAPVRAWAEAAESFLDSSRPRWADAARRNAERFDYSRAIDEFASHVERLAADGSNSHEPREDSRRP